jgi:hypothetical protein
MSRDKRGNRTQEVDGSSPFSSTKVKLTFNPFVYYSFPSGWYLLSAPVMTSQWAAKPGNRRTVPLGGGFGRLFRIDRLPTNARVQMFRNVERPDFTARWTAQVQIQFLFPHGTAHHS